MNENFELTLAQGRAELELKTASHDSMWQLGQAAWSVNQDAGQIVFTTPNGIVATAPVQILGTYNTLDQTWLWGWDHPSIQPELTKDAQNLKAYGVKMKLQRLTTRKLVCSESECWDFAALACKLCDAQGAYRGPSGTTMVFMTFGSVTLNKASQRK